MGRDVASGIMSPLDGDAMPRPKSAQLARGQRRYRRHVASPKQWQALQAAKIGPCRVCLDPASNGRMHGHIQFHHLVSREDHGDDYADNLVPLCPSCHNLVTRRNSIECRLLLDNLTDAEYAYMIERGGENYPERAYGLRYSR
jgi:5-methylcytosine-specific restriction endonuclease McrA